MAFAVQPRFMALLALACAAQTAFGVNQTAPIPPRPKLVMIDKHSMHCPTLTNNTWAGPVWRTCRNQGIDKVACMIAVAVSWLLAFLVCMGSLRIYLANPDNPLLNACLKKLDKHFGDDKGSRTVEGGNAGSQGSSPSALSTTPFRTRFDDVFPGHTEETGRFVYSHLGMLVSRDHELRQDLAAAQKQQRFYEVFAQWLGLWNLTIPACSIVLQGILKAGRNAEQESLKRYQDTDYIDYEEYDLEECARTFRNGMVAIFTILAILTQSLNKVFKPDVQLGVCNEKVSRLLAKHQAFVNDVSSVGSGDKGGGGGAQKDQGHD
eukprot:TRINITY_DN92197_c0_g1_i1.p1 TRINITY_DN92197_c0_g1~~TRINITY_DN92197_c0_g1_i1.p1  ORF type:complete len:321 (+),score=47.95 TRINITY_DN92197_c0_g1_i1:119-1081(+)